MGTYLFVVRVVDSTGVSAQANVTIVVNPGTLSISTLTLPDGTPNTPYDARLTATGGGLPYSWAFISGALPAGITLRSDGALVGTPTTPGTYNFGVRVTDTPNASIGYLGGSATRDFVLLVGGGQLTIAPTTLPLSIVGQPFTSTLTATGGVPPYTWSVTSGTLQPGVTFGANGVFTGTPTAAGLSTYTVQVRDSVGQIATRDIAVTTVVGLGVTNASLDDGAVGVPYRLTLTAENGRAPYIFSPGISATGATLLPPGLTLDSSGNLTGTPTTAGTFATTIRVLDSNGQSASRTYNVVIRGALSLFTDALPPGNAGTAYAGQITATGGFPGYTFAVMGGALPPGLTLAPDGAISGTPTAAGSYTVTVRVTDSRGGTQTRTYTMAVTAPSLPLVTVTQINDTTAPASQPAFGITLGSPYLSPIDGTVTLTFTPDAGPTDPDVKFSNGSMTTIFTIPSGSLNAVPGTGAPFAFSAGTTAGVITLTVVTRSNGQVQTVTRTVRIARAAPTITSVRINRTSTGFDLLVAGYSNTREISGGNLKFNPASGVTLAATDFPLNVGNTFQTWYATPASAGFGTQFLLTIPFTVADGTAASLSTVLVTLTNAVGSGSALGTF